ncbi:MAG TPA: YbhB/YbcL family Raf kinase inhibitor-like protein [Casimicrobiaceae bacterium]|nr:YbhB/YbcL family Raf kinase inhibitor-like protein [Casimicrobiaceae bacterium]
MNAKPCLSLVVSSLFVAAVAGCGGGDAQTPVFSVTSPDLASGTFANSFVLNGFGCTGGNLSPAVVWSNPPAGTQSFSLQMFDPDAPTGSGFWHWAIYNIPATTTNLPRGAGNSANTLPAPAFGGNTDFLDTGTTGGNGNYGGPCPPVGDKPHRYIITIYALNIPDVQVAAGLPRTGTAGLYSFALNKAIGSALIAKTTFTATYGR